VPVRFTVKQKRNDDHHDSDSHRVTHSGHGNGHDRDGHGRGRDGNDIDYVIKVLSGTF